MKNSSPVRKTKIGIAKDQQGVQLIEYSLMNKRVKPLYEELDYMTNGRFKLQC